MSRKDRKKKFAPFSKTYFANHYEENQAIRELSQKDKKVALALIAFMVHRDAIKRMRDGSPDKTLC